MKAEKVVKLTGMKFLSVILFSDFSDFQLMLKEFLTLSHFIQEQIFHVKEFPIEEDNRKK